MTDDEKIKLERQSEKTTLANLRFRLRKTTDVFSMSATIINLHEVMGEHSHCAPDTAAAFAHVQDQAQEAIALIQDIAKLCNEIERGRG